MITELYAKDNKGQMRVWSVEELPDGIMIRHGVLGGTQQEKFEHVDEGLQSRSLEEQITSRAESRINKKLDSGYCTSQMDADCKPRTNSLGYKKPMLAAKHKDVKDIDENNLWYQYKYDGNRMPVINENGTNTPYSRQGKLIETIPEITEGIVMSEGMTIDGEIYCHGQSLQTIVSWVKRRQENSLKLRYHVYDIMLDVPYEERLSILMQMDFGDYAELVPTYKFDPETQSITELLKEARDKGYEGLILRQNDCGYEDGKRSKSLIKVKHFDDDEFLIRGMHLSKDGLPMLDLVTNEGVEFKATAPGSMIQKQAHYDNCENLVGKFSHTEYANLTSEGKPFHAVSLAILDSRNQLK